MSANNFYSMQKRLLFKTDYVGKILRGGGGGGGGGGRGEGGGLGGSKGKIGSEYSSFTTYIYFQMIMDQPGLWVYRIKNI